LVAFTRVSVKVFGPRLYVSVNVTAPEVTDHVQPPVYFSTQSPLKLELFPVMLATFARHRKYVPPGHFEQEVTFPLNVLFGVRDISACPASALLELVTLEDARFASASPASALFECVTLEDARFASASPASGRFDVVTLEAASRSETLPDKLPLP
jgi:hypothetical protein